MDKVYIDSNRKTELVELPHFGEVRLIIKEGKVVKYDVTASHKIAEKQ